MATLKLYSSYSFKDKDPVIAKVRHLIETEGMKHSDVALKSGVSENTLYQWFNGATLRPQYATVTAVIRSLGYDFQIVRGKNRINSLAVGDRNVSAKAGLQH